MSSSSSYSKHRLEKQEESESESFLIDVTKSDVEFTPSSDGNDNQEVQHNTLDQTHLDILKKNVTRRKAHLGGTWYKSDPEELSEQIDHWMRNVEKPESAAKAIIAPHASFHRSGNISAYAYKQIDPDQVKTVFLLGNSHNVEQHKSGLSGWKKCQTPFYDLEIDENINQELLETGEFEILSTETEKNEHSIETQLPFLAKVMGVPKSREFTIVPILVGDENVEACGKILSKYLLQPYTLFILSSDFCHWGRKFRFTKYNKKYGQINKSIKALDQKGMHVLEKLSYVEFFEYLKSTGNPICGANVFLTFLASVEQLIKEEKVSAENMTMKFLNYGQSAECKTKDDHSVSYAAGTFVMKH